MNTEMADRDVLEQWFGAQAAPWWLAGLLAATSFATVGLAQVAGREVTHYLTRVDSWDGFHWPNAFTAVLGAALAIAWMPEWRLPRALRVAVLLPIVHAGAVVAGIAMFGSLLLRAPRVAEDLPVLRVLPITTVVLGAAVLTLGAGRVIAGRRRGEWLHASTLLALVQLLLVGTWLPLAIAFASKHHASHVTDDSMAWVAAPRLIAFVLVPPLLAALAFTTLAIRRFERLHAHRRLGVACAVVLVIAATMARVEPTELARYA